VNIDAVFSQLIQVGRVSEMAEDGSRYKVAFDGDDGEYLSGWLQVLTQRAGDDVATWNYDVGEQVLVLAMAPNLAVGVIVGALYQASSAPVSTDANIHTTKYKDGTEVSYNRDMHELTINAVGDISVNAVGDVNVNATGQVKLNDGAGVVTGECVCAFTGAPHLDVSTVVLAGKT